MRPLCGKPFGRFLHHRNGQRSGEFKSVSGHLEAFRCLRAVGLRIWAQVLPHYTRHMAIDLSPFVTPSDCAVIVFECQENVLGPSSLLPGLAAAAREAGMLKNIRELLEAGRGVGVRIFYCTAETRAGGLGSARTPLMDRIQPEDTINTKQVDTSIMREVAPEKGDVVITRSHGMSAFHDSGLDPCLRDLGIRTVIAVGVSLNIGLFGTVLEAVNRGYRTIVPVDCTATDPPEYSEQILRYSIRHLAYLSTSGELADFWKTHSV